MSLTFAIQIEFFLIIFKNLRKRVKPASEEFSKYPDWLEKNFALHCVNFQLSKHFVHPTMVLSMTSRQNIIPIE